LTVVARHVDVAAEEILTLMSRKVTEKQMSSASPMPFFAALTSLAAVLFADIVWLFELLMVKMWVLSEVIANGAAVAFHPSRLLTIKVTPHTLLRRMLTVVLPCVVDAVVDAVLQIFLVVLALAVRAQVKLSTSDLLAVPKIATDYISLMNPPN